jgi:hypothetical protein
MWSVATGVLGLCVGAYIGADIMNRYSLSFGTAADRLVGKLRIDAMLLRFATAEGLTLDKSPTAQSLVRESEITTTSLGLVAGTMQRPESASEAVKLLQELSANPLVTADAESARGAPAKVARDCLMAELPKAKPDYVSCAANVSAAYRKGELPALASK